METPIVMHKYDHELTSTLALLTSLPCRNE